MREEVFYLFLLEKITREPTGVLFTSSFTFTSGSISLINLMGRSVFLSALLLGIIGVASASFKVGSRLEFPANPNEGCNPAGVSPTAYCPSRMECFLDDNFPLGGRCECTLMFQKVRGKLPFNDLEWDDGFTSSDCISLHVPRAIGAMWYFVLLTMSLALIHTSSVVIRELWRAKALRWNATAYSLVWTIITGYGLVINHTMLVMNFFDLDKNEYWYTRRLLWWTPMTISCWATDAEIGVTWIDLYDRTNKMSKSSSRALKVLRATLRLCYIGFCLGYVVAFLWGPYSSVVTVLVAGSFTWLVFVAFGGMIILKVLLPDKKDVSNPNYKMAQAIRRGVFHVTGFHLMEFLLMIIAGIFRNHPVFGTYQEGTSMLFWMAYTARNWCWLQYLIFGSRKHLRKFASDNASAYFGFSTIGLNKTLTVASSRASSALSSISTRSSAASSSNETD